jgi:N-acetylglucosamine-6-phosphate deacetylase
MKNKLALTHYVCSIAPSLENNSAILIENGRISGFTNENKIPSEYEVRSLSGNELWPGFIDIQVNGGGGVLFNDHPTVEGIETIAAAHRKFGTAYLFPTLISDDIDKVERAIAAVDNAIEKGVPGVVGIHLEGPFLHHNKKGIHDASKFVDLCESYIPILGGLKYGKTFITLAPDAVPTETIKKLQLAGCTVFAGHTNATYEQCMLAEQAGLSGYTHLFNAMSPLQSRAPGAVGAALSSDSAYYGLIADGHHVHPACLTTAIKANPTRAILVTDAMPTVGSQQPWFYLGEQKISVSEGRCTNDEGTLAGSHLTMIDAVKNTHSMCGIPYVHCVEMASLHPASALGLADSLGQIKIGYAASFCITDTETKDIVSVFIDGIEFPRE